MNDADMAAPRPGPVLIGIEGVELRPREKEWLNHPLVGGVVLFTRNYHSLPQLELLNASIRETAKAPMLICVDHEGGRVQRFRDGFTRLPNLALLGRLYADSADVARDFAYRHGRVMATELLVAGVDHSFAPVLDLDVESCVIGDRSFSSRADAVTDLGRHYLAGMHDSGMKTCGKHFPGHGSVLADSHTHDVVDERDEASIRATDLEPFVALKKDLDAVMMAHVVYPAVDEQPAGYSKRWIRDVLREELGYEGVVLSDDLGMHAAGFAGKLPDRAQRSFEAGCDAVLVCQPEDAATLLEDWGDAPAPDGSALLRLAGKNSVTREELATVGEWRHWQRSLEELEQSKWA
ncbi:MAG: beta-N-acetylhexosaminidase [Xanthomonadales bacterium]|jgi:beta-N-acetylhexosaminidase|nr:beta-N-acetylhexosaminidase [Xanthomonadales bacterium]